MSHVTHIEVVSRVTLIREDESCLTYSWDKSHVTHVRLTEVHTRQSLANVVEVVSLVTHIDEDESCHTHRWDVLCHTRRGDESCHTCQLHESHVAHAKLTEVKTRLNLFKILEVVGHGTHINENESCHTHQSDESHVTHERLTEVHTRLNLFKSSML